MQPSRFPSTPVRFGPFEVDLGVAELRKRGRKVALQEQPFKVLNLLLQRPGDLITREELQRALWPSNTFGEFDEGLNKAVQKLRQALDDSPDDPRFIETLPRKGYRFIAAVEISIAEATAPSPQPTPVHDNAVNTPDVEPAKRRKAEVIAWLLFGVVSLALVVLAAMHFWPFHSTAQRAWRAGLLTSYPGRQIQPALSPDGKLVAFSWDGEQGDNFDVYVKLVGADAPLRLTSNPAGEFAPAWSPDGRYIAFCRAASDQFEIWMIPALGGSERRLGESATCRGLSWSPDGKYLALSDRNAPREPYSIFSLSVETGDKRKLTSPPAEYIGDGTPRFSPDGKTLAFDRAPTVSSDAGELLRGFEHWGTEIYVVPVDSDGKTTAEPRRLTHGGLGISGLDWTADGRRVVYSSGGLWMVPACGGVPERLVVPGEIIPAFSISRNGSRLVYQHAVGDSNIWRIPGPNSTDKKSAPSRFIASTLPDGEPQFSPDGTKIVFISSRSGSAEIWVSDHEGRNPVQVTSFGDPGSPRWSTDSRWIAFDSSKAGNLDIYVVGADGGLPRRLTTGPSNNARPSWSRDGRWIYFGSNRSGEWQIWKAPAQGGAVVQITKKNGGEEGFEASDGKFVYYAKLEAPGVWKVPVQGGEETKVLEQGGQNLWALTDQGICFFDVRNPAGLALKFYSFAVSRTTLLREFPKKTTIDTGSTALTVSPDGRWILYTQFDQSSSDLRLVENFSP